MSAPRHALNSVPSTHLPLLPFGILFALALAFGIVLVRTCPGCHGEKPIEPTLLLCLDRLCKFGRSGTNTLFVEAFVFYEEVDETVDVWRSPLELQYESVCDVGAQRES